MQYLGVNVPQAWAAGAVFNLIQAMLGFSPDGPNGKLYVDPFLPDWLPDLTLADLLVGGSRFDIQFWREGEETKFKVLRGDPKMVEHRSSIVQSELLKTRVSKAFDPS